MFSSDDYPMYVYSVKNDTRVRGAARKWRYVAACRYKLSTLKDGTPVYRNDGYIGPSRRSYALAERDALACVTDPFSVYNSEVRHCHRAQEVARVHFGAIISIDTAEATR